MQPGHVDIKTLCQCPAQHYLETPQYFVPPTLTTQTPGFGHVSPHPEQTQLSLPLTAVLKGSDKLRVLGDHKIQQFA